MKLSVCCWDAYHKAMASASVRVAVDIGANDGGYTRTLVEAGFLVHAFEPVPKMFRKLVEAHGSNKSVICNNVGLSDNSETIRGVTVLEAWTLAPPGTGGLRVSPDFSDDGKFDLTCITLDSYIDGRKVGLIKLDVDGYEHKVLRGSVKTIAINRPAILCEFGCYIEKLGGSAEEFVNFIFSLGYSIVPMDMNSVFTTWEQVQPQWPYHTTFDVMLLPNEHTQ